MSTKAQRAKIGNPNVGFINSDTNKAGFLVMRVKSASTPGKKWKLAINEDGEIMCQCPGFQYRGHCRHAQEFGKILADELKQLKEENENDR